MDELGIIIDQDGNHMSFGKWRERKLRVNENPDDWHDDSFRNTVYNTPWFQNLGIPYVLSDTINLHNQMDKFAQKAIMASHGIPVLPAKCFDMKKYNKESKQILEEIESDIKYPMIVKPVNLGSSVGTACCPSHILRLSHCPILKNRQR